MAFSSQVGWKSLSSTPDFRNRKSIPLSKAHNAKNTKKIVTLMIFHSLNHFQGERFALFFFWLIE
ncbi:hypothetical protein RDI58_028535 [Solanum bulbocastanum]|uniref:Uncharacterized protein n=1 Tax=Solanum bulbocastanum TaxID=147425 RepID=A0AAN8SV65_SOLBU